MGYITTVLTPEERRKAGPKNGAQATATISLDPGGAVSVHVSSVPQGQGHRTVASQIVADALGPQAQRHPRHHRHGYGARRLVDRVGQLREPFRAGGVRRGAARGGAAEGQARARAPPRSSTCRRTRSSSRTGACGAQGQSRQRAAVRPPRRRGALGARHARRGRPGAARDGVLDAAAAHRRRPTTTRSTPRSATASSSISAASRSIASPARCASTNTSPCTTAAACCIPAWWRGR